jgi:hypothetical protein
MAKTLKEKIHDVVFGICAGGIIYFIIAFLMKTDFLSNPKKLSDLYEVFRDTLTLMAYFLAPAAAFTLFNDWREEHQVKATITLLDEVKKLASEIEVELLKYNQNIRAIEVSHPDKLLELGESYELSFKLSCLSRIYLEIDENNEKLLNFQKRVKVFQKSASRSAVKLKSAGSAMQLLKLREQTFGDDSTGIFSLRSQYEGKLADGERSRGYAVEDFDKLINEIKLLKTIL